MPQSGIYQIVNTITQDCYVGSSVNLARRKREHFNDLRKGNHINRHLQAAFSKYGDHAFSFVVLEEVLERDNLTVREKQWITQLRPRYNNTTVVFDRWKRSPEDIERIRQKNRGKKLSDEHKEAIRKSQTGRHPTPETLEKLRQSHMGQRPTPESLEKNRQAQLGRTLSPEAREKIRQSKLGKKRSPELREKLRQANLGKKQTPEHIAKRMQYGVSEETKQKLREARNAADIAGKPHGGIQHRKEE